MKFKFEVIFTDINALKDNVILILRNPTEKKVVETFNEIVEKGEAKDPIFQIEIGFLWRIVNAEGDLQRGAYSQIGGDNHLIGGFLEESDVERGYRRAILSIYRDSDIVIVEKDNQIECKEFVRYSDDATSVSEALDFFRRTAEYAKK